MKTYPLFLALGLLALVSCDSSDDSSSETSEPKLIVKLSVDPTQAQLGNLGTPVAVPDTHAAQNPSFNSISAHYLELAPTANTLLGEGAVLYHAPETTEGGDEAIDFSQSVIANPGETWLEIPLSELAAGNYEWVRLSLSYQNYDILFYWNDQAFTGTVASFVGFNQYIETYDMDGETVAVNENKLQGYWGFKSVSGVVTGQAPEGATTVPNPIWDTSPIPAGSCVVTGNFDSPLEISGKETEDIILNLSLSINQSFEWEDKNGNDRWDVEEGADETVVDMGLRGLIPSYE